jgi:hypothetical protein
MNIIYLWVAIEVVLILYALYNIRKVITAYAEDKKVYYYTSDKLENVLAKVYGKSKILSFIVSEMMIFYYSLFGWFIKKKSFKDTSEYTYHKESMYSAFFGVMVILMFIETPIVHFLLSLWNENMAWVVTGLTVYSLIWFIGDYKAIKHYPIRVTKSQLLIRIGLRSKVDIECNNIDTISQSVKDDEEENYEKLLLMGELVSQPNLYISFKEKVQVKGLFGMKKEVDKIALCVDEPSVFINEVLNKEKE